MFKKIRKILDKDKTTRIIIDFFAIVIMWRGIWGLMDIFIFPHNELYSSLVSIAVGFVLIISDGKGIKELMP